MQVGAADLQVQYVLSLQGPSSLDSSCPHRDTAEPFAKSRFCLSKQMCPKTQEPSAEPCGHLKLNRLATGVARNWKDSIPRELLELHGTNPTQLCSRCVQAPGKGLIAGGHKVQLAQLGGCCSSMTCSNIWCQKGPYRHRAANAGMHRN